MKIKKGTKIFLVIVLIIIVILAIIAYMILDKNDYKVGDSSSLKGEKKILEAQRSGQKVVLNSKELNDMVATIFYGETKNIDSVSMKTPQVYLKGDFFGIKIPIETSGIQFVLSSEGKVEYDGKDLTYIPEKFKLGKLPMPRSTIIKKIQSSKYISVVDNNIIKIKKESIPFSIKNLNIEDSKLIFELEKTPFNLIFKNKDVIKKIISEEIDKVKDKLGDIRENIKSESQKVKLDNVLEQIKQGDISKELLDNVKQYIDKY